MADANNLRVVKAVQALLGSQVSWDRHCGRIAMAALFSNETMAALEDLVRSDLAFRALLLPHPDIPAPSPRYLELGAALEAYYAESEAASE